MIRLTYAPDVDALAVWLAPGAKTSGAGEIAPDTYADFDQDGRLLDIEVLKASGLYHPAELGRSRLLARYYQEGRTPAAPQGSHFRRMSQHPTGSETRSHPTPTGGATK